MSSIGFTGTELLKNIKKRTYTSKAELVRECGYQELDYYGEEKILQTEGLLATCIQHEMDHLEGILFIDYLSKLKKDMIVKKLIKQKKEFNKVVL